MKEKYQCRRCSKIKDDASHCPDSFSMYGSRCFNAPTERHCFIPDNLRYLEECYEEKATEA